MGQEICIKVMVRLNSVYVIKLIMHSNENINVKHLIGKNISDIAGPSKSFCSQIHVNLEKGLNQFIIYSDSEILVDNISVTLGNTQCQICIESYNINNSNNYICSDQLNFFDIDVTNDILSIIDKNIESFSRKITQYKNILFMCTDGPNYGGAGINCNDIQNFYSRTNINGSNNYHQTYCIYHTLEKIEKNNDSHCVINVNCIEETIQKLKFVPDLIILKNCVPINIKKYFSCPVYFCVPGIFMESLSTKYTNLKTKTEHDMYIDQNILNQISTSDKIFCNSSHTKDILYKFYNIKSELFYSSFVNYYGKVMNIPNNFKSRKYDFAIIVSNVERQIKNVQESINFINSHNKSNVIVIGKGSHKYKHLGFECVESILHDEISDILKNTKFVVQDSFYESCSNVKVEANFAGCIVVNSSTVIGRDFL